MYPAAFEYHRVTSVEEAGAHAADEPKPVAVAESLAVLVGGYGPAHANRPPLR